MSSFAYVLRCCDENLKSHNNFQWPSSGHVSAPDWNPAPINGNGLHGWLNGEGEPSFSVHYDNPKAKWLIVKVANENVVHLDRMVKFSSGEVVFVGNKDEAAMKMYEYCGNGKKVIYGQQIAGDNTVASAGYRGIVSVGRNSVATSGDSGSSVSGDHGTSISGFSGTSVSGEHGKSISGVFGRAISGLHGTSIVGRNGIAIAGHYGKCSAGENGIIQIFYCSKNRLTETVVGHIGQNGLKPNVLYSLDQDGNFVESEA